MKDENKKRRLRLGDIIRKMSENPPSPNDVTGTPSEKEAATESNNRSRPATEPSIIRQEMPPQPAFSEKKAAQELSDSERKKDISPPLKASSAPPEPEPKEASSTARPQEIAVTPLTQQTSSVNQQIDFDDEEYFDIFRYISVIIRRKEVIILTTVIMGLFSTFSYLKSEKYYHAVARLLYRPNQESIIEDRSNWRYYADRDRNFNTHLELLKSNIVLKRVIENLGMTILPGTIKRDLTILPGEFGGEETNIIELHFKYPDAEIAQDILNELCKTYVDYRREVNAQEDTRLILNLKIQIDKVQHDLNNKEDALREFKEKNRMVSLSQDANLLTSKLADMEIALQQTQLNLFETKKRLTTLQSQIGQQQINVIQSMTYENPTRSRLAELELELNTLSGEYSPDHFKIKQITQQIENLKQAMQSEIEKEVTETAVKHTLVKNPIRESLLQTYVNQNIEISALEAKRTAQEQIIEKLNVKTKQLPALEQEFAFLQREKEALEKTFRMLKIKLEETKIKRDSKESELKILELATVPKTALSSKKMSSIIIGLFIGFIIGIALVLLLEYLDQSLKDPAEVEKNLELPLIGIVPLIETENAIVDNENLTKSILEPFRALRANIKHIATQHHAKLFMICSAVKGEGKTTLAINLAITFALDGKKVILLDGDLRRSQIHNLLNIKKEPGLSDYLTGKKTLPEIIKPTVYNNLFVITSGERPHNPAELLGIPQFSHLLAEMRNQADIIICDSPALIPVSDSMSMAPHMDCCIMVVRALWTPIKAAKQAKNQLVRIGSKLAGSILNGISHSRGYYPYYYGYYGYYAYSYKYSYDNDKEPRKKLTIREFGLTIERAVKSFLQGIRVSIPRYIILIGNLFKHLLNRTVFWLLLLILLAVTLTRYYSVPPLDTEDDASLITYLDEQSTEAESKQPIAVIPSSPKKDTLNVPAPQHTMVTPESDITSGDNAGSRSVQFEDSLTLWCKSYNAADTSRLLQFYDKTDFKYPGGGYRHWRSELISNILHKSNQDSIITIDTFSVKKIKSDYMQTTTQYTISRGNDTFSIEKIMVWQFRNRKWRIIREKSKSFN